MYNPRRERQDDLKLEVILGEIRRSYLKRGREKEVTMKPHWDEAE